MIDIFERTNRVEYLNLAEALRVAGYIVQYTPKEDSYLFTLADAGFKTVWMKNGYLQFYIKWTKEEGYSYCMTETGSWGKTSAEQLLWLLGQFKKKPMNEGRKDDAGKPRWSLVPKGTMLKVVSVLTFGAKKYGDENWHMVVEEGPKRYYDAMMRHIGSWWEGEKTDPESGVHHLAHAICCALFLMWKDNKDGE